VPVFAATVRRQFLGVFAKLMTGVAFDKNLLAKGCVLETCSTHPAGKGEGSKNANLKICRWANPSFLDATSFDALQHNDPG
jgi:hypothetical protein